MNAPATLPYADVASTLAIVLARLQGHDDEPLAIQYGDRHVQPGYHITEVKAGSFTTLDCGGNPDAWQETVLQIEDIALYEGRAPMTAGRFRSILAKVDSKVRLQHDARLTVEIGRPGEAMQVFDIADIEVGAGQVRLVLGMRPAICKPRHRSQAATAACCTPQSTGQGCC